MAASNRGSATVHPDPPPPPPAVPPPSPLRCIKALVIVIGVLSTLFLILYFSPYYPTFHLISVTATPISTTAAATWHLSLKVSNPNPIWSIMYDTFHVSLFYVGRDNYSNFESQIIAETDLGPLVQIGESQKMLYIKLYVTKENAGNIAVKKIIKDQRKLGLVRFRIRVWYLMKLNLYGQEWEQNRIFCDDLNIVFNNSGPGFASDLPKKCDSFSKVPYYY